MLHNSRIAPPSWMRSQTSLRQTYGEISMPGYPHQLASVFEERTSKSVQFEERWIAAPLRLSPLPRKCFPGGFPVGGRPLKLLQTGPIASGGVRPHATVVDPATPRNETRTKNSKAGKTMGSASPVKNQNVWSQLDPSSAGKQVAYTASILKHNTPAAASSASGKAPSKSNEPSVFNPPVRKGGSTKTPYNSLNNPGNNAANPVNVSSDESEPDTPSVASEAQRLYMEAVEMSQAPDVRVAAVFAPRHFERAHEAARHELTLRAADTRA